MALERMGRNGKRTPLCQLCVFSNCGLRRGIEYPLGPPSVAGRYQPRSKQGVTMINKDEVKGSLKDVTGKVQAKAGKLIESIEQEAKDLKTQVKDKAEKALGGVKEAVKDAKEAIKDAVEKH
jgi:uncharacterized protein YjbJ (UPF0337 family)